MGEVGERNIPVDLSGAVWQRSPGSRGPSENGVEVAFLTEAIAVRRSDDPGGPVLLFTALEWEAFVAGAKDGEFDP